MCLAIGLYPYPFIYTQVYEVEYLVSDFRYQSHSHLKAVEVFCLLHQTEISIAADKASFSG